MFCGFNGAVSTHQIAVLSQRFRDKTTVKPISEIVSLIEKNKPSHIQPRRGCTAQMYSY